MKKDKEWAQKEVDRYLSYEGVDEARNALVFAKGVINQLDEPEVPVLPQFVADYIEKWKSEGLTMSEWFGFNYDDEVQYKVFKWLYDNDYEESTTREDLLIDAIRHGYEVEKEPKYYVLDKEGATLLKKSAVSEGVAKSVGTNIHSAKSWKDEKKYQLTEQEIKDYDERYWAFAQEVCHV